MASTYEPDPVEVERSLQALESAAFTAVLCGASVEEILFRYERGVMLALDQLDMRENATRQVEDLARDFHERFGFGQAAAA